MLEKRIEGEKEGSLDGFHCLNPNLLAKWQLPGGKSGGVPGYEVPLKQITSSPECKRKAL